MLHYIGNFEKGPTLECQVHASASNFMGTEVSVWCRPSTIRTTGVVCGVWCVVCGVWCVVGGGWWVQMLFGGGAITTAHASP